MTDSKRLFDAVRAVKGSALTQADVDRINAALPASAPVAAARADPFTALAIEHLRAEEGVVPHAYQDHLGFWTIGVGRLIDKRKGGRLTDTEIDFLLANDIARFTAAMEGWPAWERVKGDTVRAVALLSMCFQMGPVGLSGFKNTLAYIAAGNWDAAAAGMLASLWAKQTPARSKRVAAMIRTGRMS